MDVSEFLVRDYELKVGYLSAHFSRMWTRFNFFLTINAGLSAVLLAGDGGGPGDHAFYVSLVGALLAFLWWSFGAQDRALVEIYRTALMEAAVRVETGVAELRSTYSARSHYVGETEVTARFADVATFRPFGWRSRWISVTRLAAFLPLVVLALWCIALWLLPLPGALDAPGIAAARSLLGAAFLAVPLILIAIGIERTRRQLGAGRAAVGTKVAPGGGGAGAAASAEPGGAAR